MEFSKRSYSPAFRAIFHDCFQFWHLPHNKKKHAKCVAIRIEYLLNTIVYSQRIEQRIRCESELRQRIEQLEKRQTQDDAVLNVVNRYWNQLNEDIRVLLQRFDAETADEAENKSRHSLIRKIQNHPNLIALY